MGVKLKNWDKAGKLFEFTLPKELEDVVDEAIKEAQDTYSESILEVLAEQPADWTPKSEEWAKRSGSSDLFYGQTGEFVMDVTNPDVNTRGVRAKKGDKRLFVGARYDVVHSESGLSVETLAEILQSIPDGSRDLFERAYERVSDKIDKTFERVGFKLK